MKKSKGNTTKRFSDEVKAKAVALWRNPHRTESMSSIAQAVGTSQQSVRAWVEAADKRDKAAKRETAAGRAQSKPAEPAAKPAEPAAKPAEQANGHAAKPAQKGLLELTQDLQLHMEAIKKIKGQLRKLLD